MRTEGPCDYYAAGVVAEAQEIVEGRGPWLGLQYWCPDCGRQTMSLQYDGRCDCCSGYGDEESYYRQRQGRAIRKGWSQTIEYLRRIGQVGEVEACQKWCDKFEPGRTDR